jgi:hypothetical protein
MFVANRMNRIEITKIIFFLNISRKFPRPPIGGRRKSILRDQFLSNNTAEITNNQSSFFFCLLPFIRSRQSTMATIDNSNRKQRPASPAFITGIDTTVLIFIFRERKKERARNGKIR